MERMDDNVVVGDSKDATATMQWMTTDDDGDEGWWSTQQ